MTLLVAGLALFIAIHAVPSIAPLRAALVAGMGQQSYRAVFSLIAFASIALIVWGFSEAPFEPVYSPAPWGRHAAMIAMPVSAVLFVAANMPTHIRAVLRHPMLLGCSCGHSPTSPQTVTWPRSFCSAVSRRMRYWRR